MTFRQVIRPSQADDIQPHEHDTSEVSGVFGFLRALRTVIDGDLTLRGFLRTAASGPRIEIRPDSGVGAVPAIQWIDPDGQFASAEIEDQGGGIYALKIFGPNDGGGSALIKLREDGFIVLDSDDPTGFIEVFKYLKTNQPIRLANGSAAAPSLTTHNDQTLGVAFASGAIIAVVAGSEVARFTGAAGHNLAGLAWTTWTPTLTNLNIGSAGVQVAAYVRIGDTVHAHYRATLGGDGISVGDVRISLPATMAAAQNLEPLGPCLLRDAGTATYSGVVEVVNTTTVTFREHNVSGSLIVTAALTSNSPFTWVAGDILAFNVTYEAA